MKKPLLGYITIEKHNKYIFPETISHDMETRPDLLKCVNTNSTEQKFLRRQLRLTFHYYWRTNLRMKKVLLLKKMKEKKHGVKI